MVTATATTLKSQREVSHKQVQQQTCMRLAAADTTSTC
jgi:hypothetical protein